MGIDGIWYVVSLKVMRDGILFGVLYNKSGRPVVDEATIELRVFGVAKFWKRLKLSCWAAYFVWAALTEAKDVQEED